MAAGTNRCVHVGVIGGGITGLTSAYYLLRAGFRVSVLEAGPQLGGLATCYNFGPFTWDKYYHCILTSDADLLRLIKDLGLEAQVQWTETKTGFFADGALHSMSSAMDFLRFPPLSLLQKFRLGLGILYAARVRDGRALERELASEWLTRIFGAENYRKMWGPLLRCKLGRCREETSAAFIWTYIARYYSTREKSRSRKERLGYVTGGYRTVFARLAEGIERMGGQIVTGLPVDRIRQSSGVEVLTPRGRFDFDQVIATVPTRPFVQMAPDLSPEYVHKLTSIKYLGLVCFALLVKRQLSPYYILNLTDESLPFTGVIEMTNLISRSETAGYHLVYLPKYTSPGDPLFDASEEEIWKTFRDGLRRIWPDLQDSDIAGRHIMRERLVQPVPVLDYSSIVPDMRTNIPGVWLANTTQIINSNLNNNAMVRIATRVTEAVIGELDRLPARSALRETTVQTLHPGAVPAARSD